MKFVPKTDDEIKAEFLLKPGTYEAVVMESEDQVSKKGKEMLMVKLNIDDHHIYDYISPHFFQYKWKHFFKSAGKMEYYEKGEASAEDVKAWRVLAIIDIQKQEGYPDKNSVYDYVTADEVEGEVMKVAASAAVVEVATADDLPFTFLPPILIPFLVALLGIGSMLSA